MAASKKKKKKRKRAAALAVLMFLLLGVSGGGVWMSGNMGTVSKRDQDADDLLPDLDPAAVAGITIEDSEGNVIELGTDESGGWVITAPVSMRAEYAEVMALLDRLQQRGWQPGQPLDHLG